MVVCFSNTEEQRHWKFAILIQRCSVVGVFF